jgi:glycosyltransferase involved in cell wall biosynthesis
VTRILIVTNIFPPLIGGPATFADRLGHVLGGRGHAVTVVCSSSTRSDPSDAKRPFRVVRISTANRYAYEANVRVALVRQLLTHRRILVAGLEPYVLDAVRVVPRSYIIRVPGDTVWESARNYGVTTDGFDAFQDRTEPPNLVKVIAAQRKQYLSRATVAVAPSHYLRGIVSRWPGVPSDLRMIPNGVNLAEYPERPASPRGDRPLRVLFVGRLTNWKGAETLLMAARDLPGIEVDIVGDGPELPMLAGLHGQIGGSTPITFHGRQPEDAVRKFMLANDVLVLPSNYEGMSHTLLEACAAGMVPVVSAIGGNLEVIGDGINGLTVPYGDPAALRRGLERLVADDALRQRLSIAARGRAGDFRFEATVDAYAALIEESR